MALATLSLGYSGMGYIEDYPPAIGAMGIVAGVAVGIPHRVVHVLFLESEFAGVMAFLTEGRNLGSEQIICLYRGVRLVAVEAPLAFLYRFVLEANIVHLIACCFVAIKTEFTA